MSQTDWEARNQLFADIVDHFLDYMQAQDDASRVEFQQKFQECVDTWLSRYPTSSVADIVANMAALDMFKRAGITYPMLFKDFALLRLSSPDDDSSESS